MHVTTSERSPRTQRASGVRPSSNALLVREQDKQELFMKVDQECSGDLDLFAFLNFFLVTSHEQLNRHGAGHDSDHSSAGKQSSSTSGAESTEFSRMPLLSTPKTTSHREHIIGIHRQRSGVADQIATVSRDGMLFVWSSDLKLRRSFRCNDPKVIAVRNEPTSRPGVVVASCQTPISNLIGVASMKRIIRFFDILADKNKTESGVIGKKQTSTLTFQYPEQPQPIMCLDVASFGKNGQEILAQGSDEGHVAFQILKPGWHKVPISTSESSAGREALTPKIFFRENPVVRYHPHTDWVTKAAYVESLNSVASASVDNVLSLYDLEHSKIKWSLNLAKVQSAESGQGVHTRGIQTWDHSDSFKMFATGGVEQTIQLWSPFVNTPIGKLQGGSSIVQLMFSDRENQLIALEGTHKRVRLWDIRMQKAIGEVQDAISSEGAGFGCMQYDSKMKQLLVGVSRPQMYMKKGTAAAETIHPYVALAVCEAKGLIAAADEQNEIHIWRVDSGVCEPIQTMNLK